MLELYAAGALVSFAVISLWSVSLMILRWNKFPVKIPVSMKLRRLFGELTAVFIFCLVWPVSLLFLIPKLAQYEQDTDEVIATLNELIRNID